MKPLRKTTWVKWALGGVGALVAGAAIMLGGVMVGYPAISQLVGLAVAQSATLWNNVIDAAKGDGQLSGILGMSPYVYNGVSFDRVRGTNGAMNVNPTGAITPGDAFVNPTTAITTWSLNGTFNGTTWDRLRSAVGDAMVATGMQGVGNMVFNGGSFDRMRSATADGMVATGIAAAGNMVFNGTGWDRRDGISNTNNVAVTSTGVAYSTPLSTWSVTHSPAANNQATATKAGGGGTVRHVATSITVCTIDTAGTGSATIAHLRDGGTGAGTVMRTWYMTTQSVTGIGQGCYNLSGLNMSGSANTAMTLEFTAAGGANVLESVTVTGYSTP